jgi:hypothetical protein
MQQAANGDVVRNDDTSMTVLALQRPNAPRGDPDDVSPDRTGVFTSGILSTRDGHRIALFVTGRRHAGDAPAPGPLVFWGRRRYKRFWIPRRWRRRS